MKTTLYAVYHKGRIATASEHGSRKVALIFAGKTVAEKIAKRRTKLHKRANTVKKITL